MYLLRLRTQSRASRVTIPVPHLAATESKMAGAYAPESAIGPMLLFHWKQHFVAITVFDFYHWIAPPGFFHCNVLRLNFRAQCDQLLRFK